MQLISAKKDYFFFNERGSLFAIEWKKKTINFVFSIKNLKECHCTVVIHSYSSPLQCGFSFPSSSWLYTKTFFFFCFLFIKQLHSVWPPSSSFTEPLKPCGETSMLFDWGAIWSDRAWIQFVSQWLLVAALPPGCPGLVCSAALFALLSSCHKFGES